MAKIPGFEKVILEVLESADESLGLQTVEKNRFANFDEMNLEYYQSLMQEAIDKISRAIGVELPNLHETFLQTLIETFSINKRLYKEVHTHNATDKQVLWELMSRVYIPGVTIHLVKYDFEMSERWDKGMPSREFLYLPSKDIETGKFSLPIHKVMLHSKDIETGKLFLPVQKVMRWWLDLLGVGRTRLADMIVKGLKSAKKESELEKTKFGNVEDNLKAWYTGSSLPSADKIKDYCSIELTYRGTFNWNKTLSAEEQFQAALAFVRDEKALSPEALSHQIIIKIEPSEDLSHQFFESQEIMKAVYSGKVSDKLKAEFVQQVAERFAQPTHEILKKRLMLARMVQYGYLKKIAIKLGVKDPKKNARLEQNSALQLGLFFGAVYTVVSNSMLKDFTVAETREYILQMYPFF